MNFAGKVNTPLFSSKHTRTTRLAWPRRGHKDSRGHARRVDGTECVNSDFPSFQITRQPIVYLKEILKEVCNYNLKNPHKNMWELKPEYRHYKQDTPAESKEDKNSSDSEWVLIYWLFLTRPINKASKKRKDF